MRTRIIDRSNVAGGRRSDTIQSRIPTRLLAVILGIVGLSVLLASPAFARGNPGESPSSLSVALVNGNAILNWTAPATDAGSVTGYEILRRQPRKDAVGEFHTLVSNTGSQETTYTDASVNAGESYTYRVKALRGGVKSRWSRYARIDLPEAPAPSDALEPEPSSVSLAPTGLSARFVGNGVALRWEAPAADAGSVTRYELSRLVRSPGHADSSGLLLLTGSGETQWLDADASAAGNYSYKVRALRGNESSEWSDAFEVVLNSIETTETVKVEGNERISLPQNAADVLVSNFGQATDSGYTIDAVISGIAQSFTTGDDPDGYNLGSISVKFGEIGSSENLQIEAEIRDEVDGDGICALTSPGEYSADSENTFSPSTGCSLVAQKEYFLVLLHAAGHVEWLHTNSEDEDTAASEWSIENSAHLYGSALNAWLPVNFIFQIEVTRGSATTNDDEPVLTIAAGDAIEYGVAGNLGNSIAEFTVTRTGNTDEKLIFNLGFTEMMRTGTGQFNAGESIIVLKHIAIDRDEDNDPICSVTFALVPDDGYIVGTPSTATVDVQGPGTTCMDDN